MTEDFCREEENLLRTVSVPHEVVDEEVVQFVWADKVFRHLLDFSFVICRKQFRAYRCVYNVEEDFPDSACTFALTCIEPVLCRPFYEAAHQCLRNTGIDSVH